MASMIMSIMIVIWVTAMVVLKRLSGGASNAAHRNRPTGLQRPSETAGGRWLSEKIGGKTGKYRAPRSTDGHVLSREQDITCRQFGHNHPEWEEPAQRYIVHDDIEDGYIILNGKKMLRTEADAYENTI